VQVNWVLLIGCFVVLFGFAIVARMAGNPPDRGTPGRRDDPGGSWLSSLTEGGSLGRNHDSGSYHRADDGAGGHHNPAKPQHGSPTG
jgi:hypothetical protein